jgi:hypothetical protein
LCFAPTGSSISFEQATKRWLIKRRGVAEAKGDENEARRRRGRSGARGRGAEDGCCGRLFGPSPRGKRCPSSALRLAQLRARLQRRRAARPARRRHSTG